MNLGPEEFDKNLRDFIFAIIESQYLYELTC